ncbi:MAG: cell wall-active antibiotics response protein LiaF [Anaerolineae bacterium]|nr:cell wall-active antibiotics response protein LiaF [Anaerolineae bacterium]
MRTDGRIIIGIVIIAVGLVILVGNILDVDLGFLCMPAVLILLGLGLLLRPLLVSPGTAVRASVFGPVRRSGAWQVADEEIWLFVGDVNLDLSQADVPPGESVVRVFSLVNSIRVVVPEGVAVMVAPLAFLASANLFGKKRDIFLGQSSLASEDYDSAEYKIQIQPACLVSDVRVRRP